MTEQQKTKLLELSQLCQTKARYYQDKASQHNSADYLSDAKCFRVTADLLLKLLDNVK